MFASRLIRVTRSHQTLPRRMTSHETISHETFEQRKQDLKSIEGFEDLINKYLEKDSNAHILKDNIYYAICTAKLEDLRQLNITLDEFIEIYSTISQNKTPEEVEKIGYELLKMYQCYFNIMNKQTE